MKKMICKKDNAGLSGKIYWSEGQIYSIKEENEYTFKLETNFDYWHTINKQFGSTDILNHFYSPNETINLLRSKLIDKMLS